MKLRLTLCFHLFNVDDIRKDPPSEEYLTCENKIIEVKEGRQDYLLVAVDLYSFEFLERIK